MFLDPSHIKSEPIKEFIHPSDPAIDSGQSDLDAYLESYDAEHLVFHKDSEPTIFKMNTDLPHQKVLDIKNTLFGAGKGGVKATTGSYNDKIVSYSLVDIVNPKQVGDKGLKFIQRGGVVDKSLMAKLTKMGLVENLAMFYNHHVQARTDPNIVKK